MRMAVNCMAGENVSEKSRPSHFENLRASKCDLYIFSRLTLGFGPYLTLYTHFIDTNSCHTVVIQFSMNYCLSTIHAPISLPMPIYTSMDYSSLVSKNLGHVDCMIQVSESH